MAAYSSISLVIPLNRHLYVVLLSQLESFGGAERRN